MINNRLVCALGEEFENWRRDGYAEGFREGLARGGELAAKERGRQLQGAFDGLKDAALGECRRRGEEFCDGLLESIEAELRGRGYKPAPKSAGPCPQQEALPPLDGSDLE